MSDDARLVRWEDRTAAALTALALLFIVVYAAPILRPDLPAGWRVACEAANLVIWGLFWLDYLVRFVLSPDRRRFIRTHLFDLAVLVLPVLRPLRMLRLVTALLVLNRRTERWTRGRLALYVGASTVLLVLVSGLAVLDAERGSPDSNIGSYPQALWWAVVTITTVGYGDHYPATGVGRLVALGLMIGGIGLIGFVTGSLASWIVERISEADRPGEATKDDIAKVLAELSALRAEVAALRGEADPAPVTRPPPARPAAGGERFVDAAEG
ncbi:potassium channel family protein [Asanoa sp. WMMD1127]|uniref:potassium channel family protein n=1 Tax=Asanoa sp. WMMD1127 TaxID=3016107 RepID=UPI0024174748|nr:potassium channel family protein [Asanoa sp. WMMD1127]MDG4824953.1 potassium channel family protein [Asanoa sp. WMMD1127]